MSFFPKSSSQTLFTLAGSCALALAGCGGSGTTGGVIEALSVADSMAVVTTSGGGTGASPLPGTAADPASFSPTCDYNTDVAEAHVYDPSMEPLGTVNMILCLLKQTAYADLMNEGVYKAQIDEMSCDKGRQGGGSSSDTGQSSGAQQSFNIWVIESTRSSNTGAHEVEFWIPPTDSEGNEIRVRVSIAEGVSEENPFGVFELNYIEYESDHTTIRGLGNLHTLDVQDGFIGFSFYQEHGDVDVVQAPNHGAERIQANVNMFADQSQGVARILLASRENFGSGDTGIQTHEYLIAFDDAHVLRSTDGGAGVCLSRTDYATKTWRYNLYDAESGERVGLNSGFGFVTESGQYGWVGYYGLWTGPEVTLSSGDVVTRDTFGDAVRREYTVLKAPGKLVKNSRHTLALSQLWGETFEWWHNTGGFGGPGQFVRERLAYDGESWITTALFDEETHTWDVYEVPNTVDVSAYGFLGMWSESLGGQCSYVYGDDSITYFARENVGPDSDLFAYAANVDLYGLFQCLRTGITSEEATAGDICHPNLVDLESPYEYRIHQADMTFTEVTPGGETQVGLATGAAPTGGPYMWGMNSGPMVTTSDYGNLVAPHDIFSVPVFYTYETGPNAWNQFAMLRDANDQPVVFDKPIQFAYTHHTSADANGDDANDGRTFFLSYNGPGELNGIPSTGVDFDGDGNPDRWYPQFSILDGTACGPTGTEFVIRALESEQTLLSDPGNCGSLDIGPVGVLQLPTVGGWVDPDLDTPPTVSDAPRVIKGEVVRTGG